MPKDYFEDIAPPLAKSAEKASTALTPASVSIKSREQKSALPRSAPPPPSPVVGVGDRSIRNIASSRSRLRQAPPPVSPPPNMWNTGGMAQAVTKHSRWWLWLVALGALLLLGGVLLFANRGTTVTVVPRSHTVVFDASHRYTGYPAASAEAGALAYTLQTFEFEDSAAVPAEGVERVEEKAHGTITIFNEHSASSVRLIKNTRFQTLAGLVFRVPDTVTVPGKSASKAGTISIEVYADSPGEEYNVGPVARFTLPGLKTSPDMYSAVYAKSDTPFSGGFIGERPRVAPQTLESARANVRARLEEKAVGVQSTDIAGILLPGLYRISFVSESQTTEAGGGVRIHEKAVVMYPVFTPESFSAVVASSIAADAENASVRFTPGAAFSAIADASALGALESGSFPFSLNGQGRIVFNVDAEALTNALAGREKSAFEAISASFPGIETARARVSPFWSGTFPKDPADINIVLESASE
ncbi:hypothetical protein A2673_01025 [Candidatus Kaiserbacteria bacterium RIFCSPHIGHO2_01_FULL_50_13]|uniref:Baseplate protein J-like domain-containing protein n=1 Tax=Candidatus Kaiserbacteria bacterium RIFCSPLOWO2_01_FULL_50_24 TaxID=1798507 RepID=A0A1F6EMR8_9BACT|nr:MAG: hypothetical protein A2673_01025 [Candidatus Kaiserbacteria bacterium RIFCSPHIGHO2_01_FULL_50_13]OGG74941.1 MAG: hypothetical protein A3A34_03945 [Candidatus Kaiserbacteria bacterium RIFCSPLOWO2_01_FULL_50_24]OGG81743.1 MAG: hypothetical protein A3H74_01020 [Candidatus Kaiserbacteria bacterium RIFCSPLOWO2_02_FULL_51_13]